MTPFIAAATAPDKPISLAPSLAAGPAPGSRKSVRMPQPERYTDMRAIAVIGAISILMTGCVAPYGGSPSYRSYGPEFYYEGGPYFATNPYYRRSLYRSNYHAGPRFYRYDDRREKDEHPKKKSKKDERKKKDKHQKHHDDDD
jgi:hypothetical protein